MVWWGWLIIGFLLMGAELFAVDAAFYLIFVGAAAIFVGIVTLAGVTLPIWGQWLLFALLAIASMVLFRQRLYDKLRGRTKEFQGNSIGTLVSVNENVPPDGRTRVRLRGSQWTAVNVGGAPIESGSEARVVAADGVELGIEAMPDKSAADPSN